MAAEPVETLTLDDVEELEPTLEEIVTTKSLRWIFVGGKGGVGKTTTSCAIASKLAEKRDSVLILSTDPAHNLSDAFTQKFTSKPTQVEGVPHLSAMEIDSKSVENVEFQLSDGSDHGLLQLFPELLSAVPGIDEALSFAELMSDVQTMDYDVIVFDTAPTGHTLRLLEFPTVLEKALTKLASLKNQFSGALNMMGSLASQKEDLTKKFDSMRAVTSSIREMFQDASRTTFVCVCIPEFLSVYETERLVQELAKKRIDCSHIVVNQVLFPIPGVTDTAPTLPPPPADLPLAPQSLVRYSEALRNTALQLAKRATLLEESFNARRKMQLKYLWQIYDLYSTDFHVVCMPLQSKEVRGLEAIKAFGDRLLERGEIPLLPK